MLVGWRAAWVIYVVGNSIFFGVPVPTERWYGDLMDVEIEAIRKRNSKKGLFEYTVTGCVK